MTETSDLKFDDSVRYSQEHTWARPHGGLLVVGISDFAQDQLGEIIYIDLPEAGQSLGQGQEFGGVESAKTASDLYMPLGGEIVEVNSALEDQPALANQDPYGAGWLIRIRPEDATAWDALLTAEQYQRILA